jgi:hypothetical protein
MRQLPSASRAAMPASLILGPFGAPNGSVAVPYCRGRAGEGMTRRYDLSCNQEDHPACSPHSKIGCAGCTERTLVSVSPLESTVVVHQSATVSRESSDWPLDHPSQAQPLPLWHVLSRAMQLLPQAFPLEQTLQQAEKPAAAQAGDEHAKLDGPIARDAAAISIVNGFIVMTSREGRPMPQGGRGVAPSCPRPLNFVQGTGKVQPQRSMNPL